jgi:alkaline phosphatase
VSNKCRFVITRLIIFLAVVIWFPLEGFAADPKNVIFYIGDGMSSVQRRIAEEVHGKRLAMNTLPIIGLYTTDSLNSIVTDSAAAGTAMATGYKTDNSVISMDAWGEIAYETIAAAAKGLGKSVGIVTTTRLTHATPACFGSLIATRNRENEIAEQYLDRNFEVWMGGGWRHFVPKSVEKSKRKDDRDLLKEFKEKGYTVIRSKSELININIDNSTKIFGVFSHSHMPYFLDLDDEYYEGKIPSLSEMTKAAISVLKSNPEGFFLMVEGG